VSGIVRTADDVVRLPRNGDHRVPPQNVEAEAAALGSMMLSAEAIADVVELLHAEDFYRSANGRIFEVLRELYARGEPVDQLSAVEALRRKGALDDVGGPLYIRDLADQVPTPASAAHYARIVAQAALLRRLIGAAADVMDMAYGATEDPEGVADAAEQRIYDVARRDDRDEVATLRELIDGAMLELEQIQHREAAYTGLPTGFRDLDELTSGLQPGNLVIVAARPGIGKSSLAINIAHNVAVAGESVAVFSLEMSRHEVGMRMLCSAARVPWDRIRSKRVGPDDWVRVVQAAETLHDVPLSIVDSGNVNIVDIRAKARRMRTSKQGLALIIVDYLQLMTSAAVRRPDNRQQEVAEISRSLKLLAKELHIPVLALSQLNRNPETRADKRPQLSDLRECVPGDTLVHLANGLRVPIRDLVGQQPMVLSMAPGGRIIEAKSDKVWPVGERPVFEVRLLSGRRIRCTAEHRLFGEDGWVRVGELKNGDRLAIARRLPEPADPIEWPDDRVALLGQMIGDGSYLKHQPMRYTTASEENSSLVRRVAIEEFGIQVKRYRGRGSWHQLLLTGQGNRWHPTGVNAWLKELGIFNQRSHEKRIPVEAFRLSDRQVAILLKHLWATDGSIYDRAEGKRGGHTIYFATSSRGLADDVAALLLRLGIVARIYRAQKAGYRSSWHIDVSGALDQRWFLKQVGAFGPRVEPARELALRLDGIVPNTNVDTVPARVSGLVQERMAARGISRKEMAQLRGIIGRASFASLPSRWLLAEYAEILNDDELRVWASNDIFWDQVRDVVLYANDLVYDMTVPGPSSWVAGPGAAISHNSGSLEQDSDVVAFIHRDDSDPDKKREAELILAKHRNGPTASIKLNFEPSLTQFRNAARGDVPA
jgi:replicative DNA helicase